MTSPDRLIEIMHADPAALVGAPTNDELMESHSLRAVSEEVRSGFLQMWKVDFVREKISKSGYAEVNDLYAAVTDELVTLEEVEQRIRDLRFLQQCLATAKGRQV